MHFQGIAIPTIRKVLGISEGEGTCKAKFFERSYDAKLEFLEEWEGSNHKTFCGKGMDNFWNNTLHDCLFIRLNLLNWPLI